MTTGAYRRLALGAVMLAAAPLWIATALAQESAQQYPSQPIRLILPTTPGGSVDNGARILSERFRDAFGQPVIVENRAGGNTTIGTAAVAKAPPDGYTLLFVSSSHVIVPLVARKVPYDPIRDFAPVGPMAYTPFVMVVHPSVPAATVQQFIDLAKTRPGRLNFGSSGVGLGSHIAGEVFSAMTGIRMQHIPYKGGGPMLVDLMGGQLQVSWNSVSAVFQHVGSGRLRALAVTSESRVGALPAIPTFAEAGLPDYQEKAWLGLFAPAGTPRPIVDRLSAELIRMLKMPAVRKSLEDQGLIPMQATPEQFLAQLKKETATLAPIIRAANISDEGT